ncbi:MAG: amidohydrolase family protein [Flavobacteriaceae bacterium]|nr:amidohydrolase family protein [Flavobacteriaceae bacterium]
MTIDSHQHFWKYNSVRNTWIDETMQVIQRDFLPKDLKPILERNGIDGCIAVQADPSEKETVFLLELANKNSFIKGVVGWVDLCANDVEDRLNYFSKYQKFKGVRHIVQAESTDYLLQNDFQNGISKLEKFNLVYDILIRKEQLENTIKLVKKFPNQKFVLNHIAKPNIKEGEMEPWKTQIKKLAENENVYCKISGMVTETDWKRWNYKDFIPYLDIVCNTFGKDRIMFGSDWPVCLLGGNYGSVLSILNKYIEAFTNEEKYKIMCNNAVKLYAL